MSEKGVAVLAIVEIICLVLMLLCAVAWNFFGVDLESWMALFGVFFIGAEIIRRHDKLSEGWLKELLGDVRMSPSGRANKLFFQANHESNFRRKIELLHKAKSLYRRCNYIQEYLECSLDVARSYNAVNKRPEAAEEINTSLSLMEKKIIHPIICDLYFERGNAELFVDHDFALEWYTRSKNCHSFHNNKDGVEIAEDMIETMAVFQHPRDVFKRLGMKYPEDV